MRDKQRIRVRRQRKKEEDGEIFEVASENVAMELLRRTRRTYSFSQSIMKDKPCY